MGAEKDRLAGLKRWGMEEWGRHGHGTRESKSDSGIWGLKKSMLHCGGVAVVLGFRLTKTWPGCELCWLVGKTAHCAGKLPCSCTQQSARCSSCSLLVHSKKRLLLCASYLPCCHVAAARASLQRLDRGDAAWQPACLPPYCSCLSRATSWAAVGRWVGSSCRHAAMSAAASGGHSSGSGSRMEPRAGKRPVTTSHSSTCWGGSKRGVGRRVSSASGPPRHQLPGRERAGASEPFLKGRVTG